MPDSHSVLIFSGRIDVRMAVVGIDPPLIGDGVDVIMVGDDSK